MLKKVSDYIKSHNLINEGDRILVGVSGGADSVCLLHMLSTMYEDDDVVFFAVHVHHGIRDEEADRDEVFVKLFCEKLRLGYSAYHYDVISLARSEGLSEEEAGRKVRHEAFIKASRTFKCNKVAIAHNKNDNAETILFNMFRGSAVKGLTGMDSIITMKTDAGSITVIRPLLAISREEIEAYLKVRRIPYHDDLTNFSNLYTRNKIRNQVLSFAKDEINTNVIEHITNAAGHLSEAYDFIEHCINERYGTIISKKGVSYEYVSNDLEQEHIVIRKGIVRKILAELAGSLKDIEAKHVEAVLSLAKKQVGKMVHLPYGMKALREYDKVKVYVETDNAVNSLGIHEPRILKDILIPGRTDIEKTDIYIETGVLDYNKKQPFPKNSCMKWFDYDKIENTLKLRTRNSGDYLQINSHGGRKKLKDYFIDLKIPKNERDNLLLVADGNHILWVIGYGNRISEKYKINNNTKVILSMVLTNAKEKKGDR